MNLLETLSKFLPQNDIPELVLDFLEPIDIYEKLEDCEYKNILTKKYKKIQSISYTGESYMTTFDGELHSFFDKPSIYNPPILALLNTIFPYKIVYLEWHKFGKLHRERDKPTVIYVDGESHWMIDGKLHREYYPAIIKPNPQTLLFFRNGERYYPDKKTLKKIKNSENFKLDCKNIKNKYKNYN